MSRGDGPRGRMERLPPSARPRERLLARGAGALSEVELLALVLGAGSAGRDVLTVAEDVLALGGAGLGLRGLAQVGPQALLRLPGVGPARAAAVAAALELGRRAQVPVGPRTVRDPEDLAALCAPLLADLDHEEFWVVTLGARGEVLGQTRVGQGGTNRTPADVRVVFREAVRAGATAIAVAHNHPSGDPRPSDADRALTRQLRIGAELLGFVLWDHIIVGRGALYSFRGDGAIGNATQ